MQSDGVTVDDQRILRIDTGTGLAGVLPRTRCGKIFSPPRKRSTLLRADGVNITLAAFVEMDAATIAFPTVQDVPAVGQLMSVTFQPFLN